MHLLLVFMIAISLSMDAFSLSLAYGTQNFSKQKRFLLSLIVGCFHFFMPLLGHFFGTLIFQNFPISPNWVIFLVLTIIGLSMVSQKEENESIKNLTFLEMLFFAFAVSVDSFSVGVGLISITLHIVFTSFLFCLCSAFFTFLGLYLGGKIEEKIGNISTFLGGIVLILIGIFSIF